MLETQLNLPFRPDHREHYRPYYEVSGFTRPFLPVISNEDPNAIQLYRWTLLPGWVKDEKSFKANTLNARNDRLFESAVYRSYWKNRCLVTVTGFFEPHEVPDRKQNESWHIKKKDDSIMTLGGIWSKWGDTSTFTIITTDASPLMAEVHNGKKRMPLVLEGDAADAWLMADLTKDEMQDLMKTPDVDNILDAYRVMDGVTNTRVDTNVPEVLERI